jgi:hypothetical protein
VPGRRGVGAGVLHRGRVAAADMPARRAPAQMNPPAPGRVALDASRATGWDRRIDQGSHDAHLRYGGHAITRVPSA